MKNIKNIDEQQIRTKDKKLCELWLNPRILTVSQIVNSIHDFASIISINIHPKTNKEHIISDISSLIDDILEMKTISEEEKNQLILAHIHKYPEDTNLISNLAKQVIKQIDIEADNYKREALRRGYCKKLVKDS